MPSERQPEPEGTDALIASLREDVANLQAWCEALQDQQDACCVNLGAPQVRRVNRS